MVVIRPLATASCLVCSLYKGASWHQRAGLQGLGAVLVDGKAVGLGLGHIVHVGDTGKPFSVAA